MDTTVQPKAITFPTDAKLLHAAIRGLGRLARKHGVKLRQSYARLGKRAARMAGRYAHAKQFKRHYREVRFLRARLGRLIRDIGRKIAGEPALEEAFAQALARARQVRSQQQRQRGWKLYSFHAPEVECILGSSPRTKGKARRPLRVRRQGLDRDHQRARPGRPVRAARHGAAGQPLRRPHARRRHRGHRTAHRLRH